jgi:peptide/nickel transport system ATP-binding protein
MTPLLEVRDLTISFGRQSSEVVRSISFTVAEGERLGLIGESGSGKSMTALAIMGLLPETAKVTGSIKFKGHELLGLRDRQMARLRGNKISMIFQEPMTALDPTMRVGNQVAEVVQVHRRNSNNGDPQRSARDLAVYALGEVGLHDPERIADSYPHQLSGGQRQRCILAMALINRPDLVIADEPTTALDVTVQARVLRVLNLALDAVGAACLYISHDLAVVSQVCDEVMVMLDGRIVERGSTEQVFNKPEHPYVRGLVATADLSTAKPGSQLPVIEDFYREQACDD